MLEAKNGRTLSKVLIKKKTSRQAQSLLRKFGGATTVKYTVNKVSPNNVATNIVSTSRATREWNRTIEVKKWKGIDQFGWNYRGCKRKEKYWSTGFRLCSSIIRHSLRSIHERLARKVLYEYPKIIALLKPGELNDWPKSLAPELYWA